MICAVEWKRSFWVTLKYSIFLRNLCGKPVLTFFHKWDLRQVCGKQHLCFMPVFLDFSMALEAI